MRRRLFILTLLITGMLVLSVNFISPNQALLASSTVSAAAQSQPLVNLALNKPATQSSTDTVFDASRAVDGNTSTFSQTLPEVNFHSAWWEVDLTTLGLIDRVEVYNRTDCCAGMVRRYYVFVSDVPFISHDFDTTINQPEVTSQFSQFFTGGPATIILGRVGRYIRVQLDDDSSSNTVLHLAEVKVLGNALPTDPKSVGQWCQPPDLHYINPQGENIPLSLVHISLLPSSKLLFWGRDKGTDPNPDHIDDAEGGCNTYLWDLAVTDNSSTAQDERLTLIRNNRTNLFCSAHCFLPNGNLFVAGGSEVPVEGTQKRHDVDGQGTVQTNIFDYMNQSWVAGPNMNQQRWYPSVVTLSNGETLIVSGNYVSGFNSQHFPIRPLNRDTEVLDRNQSLRLTINGLPKDVPNYPYAHLGPDGNVFVVSGTDKNGLAYNPSANVWVDPLNLDLNEFHNQGTSVMYDKGKIMVIGGLQSKTSSTRDIETIDINPPNSLNSSWEPANPMNFQRYYATSVLMPDGQVFVVGGSSCGGTNNIRSEDGTCTGGAIMNPEIYNPGTGIWSIMARQEVIRMYHSVALLLPDARILVAGGGRSGAYGENGNLSYEKLLAHREVGIFSPPYLFNSNGGSATRPTITSPITSGPLSVTYGQSFNIGIGNVPASQIEKVVLVRLPSVTHTLNFDQRRVVLSRTALDQQTLSVTAPADGNECPPGPYMLFVLDQNGVPSVAKIILVDAPACNSSLLPPSGLVATAISNAQVNISWTASSGPVHHYELDRRQSISAPFIKIADIAPSATSYTDLNLTGSVAYLYQVRAVCSSGNSSQPSNVDIATTMSFTDNPLLAGVTIVKAQHLNELRVAVNAVRATAVLPQATWTDASLPGVSIKAVHINELRQNLNQALQAMGFAIVLYTDPTLSPGMIVKKAHVEELRQVVR